MTHETMQKAENLDMLIRHCNEVLKQADISNIINLIKVFDIPISLSKSEIGKAIIAEIEKIKLQAQTEFDEL